MGIEWLLGLFIGAWIGSILGAIGIGIYETIFEKRNHMVPLEPKFKFSEYTWVEKVLFFPFFPIYYLIIYTLG